MCNEKIKNLNKTISLSVSCKQMLRAKKKLTRGSGWQLDIHTLIYSLKSLLLILIDFIIYFFRYVKKHIPIYHYLVFHCFVFRMILYTFNLIYCFDNWMLNKDDSMNSCFYSLIWHRFIKLGLIHSLCDKRSYGDRASFVTKGLIAKQHYFNTKISIRNSIICIQIK